MELNTPPPPYGDGEDIPPPISMHSHANHNGSWSSEAELPPPTEDILRQAYGDVMWGSGAPLEQISNSTSTVPVGTDMEDSWQGPTLSSDVIYYSDISPASSVGDQDEQGTAQPDPVQNRTDVVQEEKNEDTCLSLTEQLEEEKKKFHQLRCLFIEMKDELSKLLENYRVEIHDKYNLQSRLDITHLQLSLEKRNVDHYKNAVLSTTIEYGELVRLHNSAACRLKLMPVFEHVEEVINKAERMGYQS